MQAFGPLKIVPGWRSYIRMCGTDIAARFNQEQEIWSVAVDFVGGRKDKGRLGGKSLSPSFPGRSRAVRTRQHSKLPLNPLVR